MNAFVVIVAIIFISFTIFPNLPTESLAHRDGCHMWHSCPSDDGSYICGDTGHYDECGGSEGDDTEVAVDDSRNIDDDDDNGNGNNGSNGDDTQLPNLFSADNNIRADTEDNDQEESPLPSRECQGAADCFTGIVTDIVDGDTLDVNNVRIRLSLVNTPERGDSGYSEAKLFTESMCPIGSKALVDEDDGQKEGSFDRVIGLVYCGNEKLLLNEHLLNEGHAQIFVDFCGVSEFSEQGWVQKFGC
jgi:endonuclease YncB( thermonuclease family)